jgi:hypothetical protein
MLDHTTKSSRHAQFSPQIESFPRTRRSNQCRGEKSAFTRQVACRVWNRAHLARAELRGLLASDSESSIGPGGIIPGKPAARLLKFVEEAGDNAVYAPICEDEFEQALKIALDTFTAACDELPPLE